MAEGDKSPIVYRCPVCLAREIDVVLRAAANGGFYCVKCGYTGTQGEIRDMYMAQRKKYRLMTTRIKLEDLERL